MTETQKAFVRKMQNYLQKRANGTYSETMNKARQDKNFERMIQSMTIDQLAGKSSLNKNQINF